MSSANQIQGMSSIRLTNLATVALLAIGYFILAVIALHFLRPDYDPVKHHLSGYALGPYGSLMTSGFFALALGSLFLARALWQGISPSGRSGVGAILLAVFGIGVAVAGIFPTDPEGISPTVSGTIHELAFLVSSLSLIAAEILLALGFRRDQAWRSFSRPALGLALAGLVAFIGLFAVAETEFAGLAQRILVVMFLGWLLLSSIRLRSLDPMPASR